jgi:type VI secretion system FHA domain protein
MSLRLIVEQAPHRQAESEREFTSGRMVIGRGDDADWKLNDPEMFVSRRHAILSEEGGRVVVTDASSGGLFVDNAANPVGTGNSVVVEPGMRLRMGDFVLRVEGSDAGTGATAPPAQGGGLSFSFDFGPQDETPAEPPKRPDTLPDPFGVRPSAPSERQAQEKRPPRPLDQEDPFALDLRGTDGYFGGSGRAAPEETQPEPVRDPFAEGFGETPASPDEITPSPPPPAPEDREEDPFGLGAPARPDLRDPFGEPAAPEPPAPSRPESPRTTGIGPDIFGQPEAPPRPEREAPAPPPQPEAPAPPPRPTPPETPPEAPPEAGRAAPQAPAPGPAPTPPGPAAPAPGDDALRAAFFRGLGLDVAHYPTDDPEAEMEDAGRRMRALVEGLMHMLRARAAEKSRARVAQTLISSADVNPLKFLVTPEDAAAALIQPRGQGYLPPDAAIAGAFRDLADHQMRTWTALQTSLRRMIDRFDPSELEREMEDTGLMERLIAGGRSAKLWQLYTERYGEIARAAEEQFLGEVGPDFRAAYESKGSPRE